MKRVARTSFSLTSILWTPGAIYHLSTRVEAKGTCSLKSPISWPLYTEKLTSRGLQTLRLLNLEKKGGAGHGFHCYNCIYFKFVYTRPFLTLGSHGCLEQVSYSTPGPWLLFHCMFPQNWDHLLLQREAGCCFIFFSPKFKCVAEQDLPETTPLWLLT